MIPANFVNAKGATIGELVQTNKSGDYAGVADEYYNQYLHPTCKNFRDASVLLFRDYLSSIDLPRSVLDVGCGRSILPDLFPDGRWSSLTIALVDQSQVMLQHTSKELQKISEIIYGEISNVRLSRSFDLAISSLGDPYNTRKSWAQVSKQIRKGGFLFYSTPTLEWASNFRTNEDGTDLHISRFLDRRGEVHDLPSIVVSTEQQSDMFLNVGFHLIRVTESYVTDLSEPISQKLITARQKNIPIVRGYLLQKQ
jgi:SAM-dependent methyltransferase